MLCLYVFFSNVKLRYNNMSNKIILSFITSEITIVRTKQMGYTRDVASRIPNYKST